MRNSLVTASWKNNWIFIEVLWRNSILFQKLVCSNVKVFSFITFASLERMHIRRIGLAYQHCHWKSIRRGNIVSISFYLTPTYTVILSCTERYYGGTKQETSFTSLYNNKNMGSLFFKAIVHCQEYNLKMRNSLVKPLSKNDWDIH